MQFSASVVLATALLLPVKHHRGVHTYLLDTVLQLGLWICVISCTLCSSFRPLPSDSASPLSNIAASGEHDDQCPQVTSSSPRTLAKVVNVAPCLPSSPCPPHPPPHPHHQMLRVALELAPPRRNDFELETRPCYQRIHICFVKAPLLVPRIPCCILGVASSKRQATVRSRSGHAGAVENGMWMAKEDVLAMDERCWHIPKLSGMLISQLFQWNKCAMQPNDDPLHAHIQCVCPRRARMAPVTGLWVTVVYHGGTK
ncbi:hypothetical protein B0H10DRAFT_2206411 [Mycena sp. CBHHK59/15]|nr:hypothetical protein B0H10DRAFT_2206411 [Mycena sp. CBHHK59/15]